MNSNKPFKTYRQQLAILRSRNLSIHNGSKAISILRREGYYNIINGYKEIFLDSQASQQRNQDCYKTGTNFEQIYHLYDFDRNLRSDLIKYILKMETNVKTKIAYAFSEHYKQNFSYLDINNYDSSNPQRATKLIARISAVITNNSQKQTQGGQIFHYLDKYKELPLWVLIKKMTLGETFHFFETLDFSIKEEIVDELLLDFRREYKRSISTQGLNLTDQIVTMLKFINKFRNICAHDERLYNSIIKDQRNKILKFTHFHHKNAPISSSHVFDCILLLGLFITKKDYKALVSQITSDIEDLEKRLPPNLLNQVLINMGFPKDWKKALTLD